MRVDELFNIRYGHGLSLNKLQLVEAPDGYNYVSRGVSKNGVAARVKAPLGTAPGLAGELSVALNGQGGALATFLQPEPFVTGYHVAILTALEPMTDSEKLWWARCIWANHYRYGFGRQANRTLASLVLPDSIPEWATQTAVPSVSELSKGLRAPSTLRPFQSWRNFTLDMLFDIQKGQRLTKRDQAAGSTPYIGSSSFANGVTNYISKPATYPGHVLTVPYNGSVGHAFYQPRPFCAGDDVHILTPRTTNIDKYALLFVATVIRHEKYRFGYGRKWHLGRMRASSIKLPVTPESVPDWNYMSQYVKGLRFTAAIDGVTQ
jgi:hypothetical protein